jgi:hypothetical protein
VLAWLCIYGFLFGPQVQNLHYLTIRCKSAVATNNKLHGLSPRANYTDRATAASRRSDCQLLRIKGATWSAWRIPPAVFSRFSRLEPLLFYQVAPQLYSRGWLDPIPDPLLFFLSPPPPENLVVPGIDPVTPDLYSRTLTTRPQRISCHKTNIIL